MTGGIHKIKGILALAGVGLLILAFQNCSSKGFVVHPNGTLSEGNPGFQSLQSKTTCQFVGADVLKERLVRVLGIPSGDVPVLDEGGRATGATRIKEGWETLGKGDLRNGRPDDLECGTTKFKVSTEIMIDACVVALEEPAVKAKLFPAGFSDFGPLYMSLVGRVPTQFEAQVLEALSKRVGSAQAEAALCGAVASSFESLIRI